MGARGGGGDEGMGDRETNLHAAPLKANATFGLGRALEWGRRRDRGRETFKTRFVKLTQTFGLGRALGWVRRGGWGEGNLQDARLQADPKDLQGASLKT